MRKWGEAVGAEESEEEDAAGHLGLYVDVGDWDKEQEGERNGGGPGAVLWDEGKEEEGEEDACEA